MEREEYKIGIVNSSTFGVYHPDLMEQLRRIGPVKRIDLPPEIEGEELAEELSEFNFLITSVTPDFSRTFFQNQEGLVLIARHGIGCDNIDLEAATKAGVPVTRVPGRYERDAVAELTISLMMACLRTIVPASRAVREGNWGKRLNFVGRELSSMTVGIIGYGNIGSRVAEIIRNGFKAQVLAYDPDVPPSKMEEDGIKPVGLDELLKSSDVLSLHASLTPESHHLIGREEFELMKNGVVIVNTARGELVEERAVLEAVRSGKVGAVGLDVAKAEPMEKDHPLLKEERVLIVPHIGSYTERSLRKMDEKMVQDIKKILEGEIPDGVVNPEVFKSENRTGIEK